MFNTFQMASDGKIQYGFISDTAHPKIKDLLLAAVDKCRDIQGKRTCFEINMSKNCMFSDGANLCEKASNFNYCMYNADPVVSTLHS